MRNEIRILRFVQGEMGEFAAIFVIGWGEPGRRRKRRKRLLHWLDVLIGAFPK